MRDKWQEHYLARTRLKTDHRSACDLKTKKRLRAFRDRIRWTLCNKIRSMKTRREEKKKMNMCRNKKYCTSVLYHAFTRRTDDNYMLIVRVRREWLEHEQ